MSNKSAIYSVSDKVFIQYVKSSESFSEILRRFGLSTRGGASRTVLFNRMAELGLSRDDLCPPKPRIVSATALNDDELFVKSDKRASAHALKKHYLRIRNKKPVCDICGISEWQGKKLCLQLDHINGDKTDNRLSNLRLVCPNCDSQLSTYRGRNAQHKHKDYKPCRKIKKQINHCQTKQTKQPKRPKQNEYKDITCIAGKYVSKAELEQLLSVMSFLAIGRKFGVSDNAIRKHCKKMGLPFRVKDMQQVMA